MSIGAYDTDTAALVRRIELNERGAARDINEWIFAELDARPGDRVLDLGCGTGKQSVPLAKIVGANGSVTAVDVAEQAVGAVVSAARAAQLADRVHAVVAALDSLPFAGAGERFDRIVASYSLYYCSEPPAVFDVLREMLRPEGVLFFCGPAHDNNAELRAFVAGIRGEASVATTKASRFMEDIAPPLVAARFGAMSRSRFENPITFDSPDALRTYWSSHNSHDPRVEPAFVDAARRHFESTASFTTTKRAVGIRAAKMAASALERP